MAPLPMHVFKVMSIQLLRIEVALIHHQRDGIFFREAVVIPFCNVLRIARMDILAFCCFSVMPSAEHAKHIASRKRVVEFLKVPFLFFLLIFFIIFFTNPTFVRDWLYSPLHMAP